MKKLIKGLFAAGAFAGVALYFRKLLSREAVSVQLQTGKQDIQGLKKAYLEEIHKRRSRAIAGAENTSQRQIIAALYDQMEESAQLLDTIQPQASVLYNGLTRSRMEKILDAVLGPAVSFLLSLLALGALIAAKWSMEPELTAGMLSGLNTALVCSAAVSLHLLLRLVRGLRRGSEDRSQIRIGVELTTPARERELFLENRCASASRNADAVCRLLEQAETPCSADLNLMADLYSQMFQARALEDYADVSGYLLPRCAGALRSLGVSCVTEYTGETAHLFDVTEAPGYGRSCVVRPALVMKENSELLSRGEYVRGG